MMTEKMIQAFDGTGLYFKKDEPTAPRGVVVIVHGLCEHQGRYDYVAKRLTEAGYAVYRFDHRGHGRSEGKPVFYHNSNEITEDVRRVVTIAKEEHPTIPVFLLGHSMGGYAVALFGARHPGMVRGIILSGPLTTNNAQLMIDLPKDTPVDTYFDNQLGDAVCRDPAIVQAYADDPYVAKSFSAGLFFTLFEGVEYLKANMSRFVDPALILHGAADGIVNEKDSRDLFAGIGSKDRTLMIFANLYHEILNEPEKDKILAEILEWLDKR